MKEQTKPNIQFYGLSDIGLARPNNEDSWGKLPNFHLYALADGMGGHRAGEVASKEAITCFFDMMTNTLLLHKKYRTINEMKKALLYAIEQTNWVVYQKSQEHKSLRGMGTTFCSLYFFGSSHTLLAHVGDSRIYCIRNNSIEQLTEDHCVLRKIPSDHNTHNTKETLSYKRLITRAVGINPKVQPTISEYNRKHGDIFLMCSDGLSDCVSEDEIKKSLLQTQTIKEAAKTLIKIAKNHGGDDNITVILIKS